MKRIDIFFAAAFVISVDFTLLSRPWELERVELNQNPSLSHSHNIAEAVNALSCFGCCNNNKLHYNSPLSYWIVILLKMLKHGS